VVASPKSFDITIQIEDGPSLPFLYGEKGGLELGNVLLEPSAPSRVDTIPIQTLHHGYGRVIATDPNMARDSNEERHFADTRQPGFIMPSGAVELLHSESIYDSEEVAQINGYAAAAMLDNGDILFAAGKQLFLIDREDDSVTYILKDDLSGYFSGCSFTWANELWLGLQNENFVTTGAYNYTADTENTDETYMFSWGGSTRNSLFWIRNRDGDYPQLRWTDRTDQQFGAISTNFIYPNATNAFVLEVPKALVTGAGVAGQYFLYATKGGNIWGLDRNEVFIPLTPEQVGFNDLKFGGQMKYVGSWLLAPSVDGLGRFDPRNVSLTDISPAVHQGATPGIGLMLDKSAHSVAPTPTGALVAANIIGDKINLSHLEMYEDGMFYHPALLQIDDSIGRVWGLITSRYFENGQFNARLKAFMIASTDDYSEWRIYKIDLATAAYSPPPKTLAPVTGFRTGFYSGRPPDINGSVTQIRGYAHASEENYIELSLEVDDDLEQYHLGLITKTGPFVLGVPSNVLPGRKFAIAGKMYVNNPDDVTPYLTLPISIDYRYVIQREQNTQSDFFTLKFMAESDQINRRTGRFFTHGRNLAEGIVDAAGHIVTIGFADSNRKWTAIIEDARADLMYREDGRTSTSYIVTLACRRIA
jgi:hypothetical protein